MKAIAKFLRDAWPHRRLLQLVAAILVTCAVLYLGWGFRQLLFGTSPVSAIDVRYRWLEHSYIVRRQNPFDLVLASRGKPAPQSRDSHVDPALGPIPEMAGGYPPWEFVLGLPIVPPVRFGFVRVWTALINAAALVFVSWFAWTTVLPHGREAALIGALIPLSLVSNLFTISAGQYGLMVNALVVLSLLLATQGAKVSSGVALAFAMVKPQNAGLFALQLAVRRDYRVLLTAAAIGIVASWLGAYLIRTGFGELSDQLTEMGPAGWIGTPGPLAWLLGMGVDARSAVALSGMVGALSAAALMIAWRRAHPLTSFAIAGVVGRLWSYHAMYDNVLLVFLLLALWRRYVIDPHPLVTAALIAVAASLLAPLTWSQHYTLPFLAPIHMAIWIGGLAVLLAREPRESTEEVPVRAIAGNG